MYNSEILHVCVRQLYALSIESTKAVDMHRPIRVRMYVLCLRTYVHVFLCVCMYAYIYIFMCASVYMCMYTYSDGDDDDDD